jgi:hypothetical protein
MVILAGIAFTLIGFAGVALAVMRGSEERERVRHLGRCRKAMGWVDTDMDDSRIVVVSGPSGGAKEIGGDR